jgi:imidazolonepropionase-like amidohydrolase
LQQEQEQLSVAAAALQEQLAQREAAAAEMSATVAAMQEDITRLAALNTELKAAMAAKVCAVGRMTGCPIGLGHV